MNKHTSFTIDPERQMITLEGGEKIDLYSKAGFEYLSYWWSRVAWHEKHTYTFSWLGRPLIQLPEDMFRLQEVIYSLKPDYIVETGIAHGGSLVFHASLCKAIGKGNVIGVDIEIRPHNRKALENHELYELITLVEGDSVSSSIFQKVQKLTKNAKTVLVILDSNHTHAHVLKELELYSELVTPNSYIVATDGILRDLKDTPRGKEYVEEGTPAEAIQDFLKNHSSFEIETPSWPFNESELTENITHWPKSWLKRIS